MTAIVFKAKLQEPITKGGSAYVVIPALTRKHCDMDSLRAHPKYGPYANSNMLDGILGRIRTDVLNGGIGLMVDNLPNNVSIDVSGFLAVVTITV